MDYKIKGIIIVVIILTLWIFIKIEPQYFKKLPYIGKTLIYTVRILSIILVPVILCWASAALFPEFTSKSLFRLETFEKQVAGSLDKKTANPEPVASDQAVITETKPEPDKPKEAPLAEPSPPEPAPTPPPVPVQAPPPAPHWEIVAEKFVTYNQWDPENFGYVTIADNVSQGKYCLEIKGNYRHSLLKYGRDMYYEIPPEGLTERYVAHADRLPLQNSTTADHKLGARIMRINGSEPEYVGRFKEFELTEPGKIEVSVNIFQDWIDVPGKSPRDNFIFNAGRDKVVLKKLVP